jgi:23S rRNA (guanosine2251-2'-O)-methyltransferase
VKKLKLEELGRLDIEGFKEAKKQPIVVVLDNLRSGMNVGAFFRTCDAFAISKIILTGICPQPPHKEIHKAAIGATLSMDWEYETDIAKTLAELRAQQYTIIGIEQTDASEHLESFVWPDKPTAIVFGNEVEGISQAALPYLDVAVDIQQYGTKHSLNVAVCGGVVLWAATAKPIRSIEF